MRTARVTHGLLAAFSALFATACGPVVVSPDANMPVADSAASDAAVVRDSAMPAEGLAVRKLAQLLEGRFDTAAQAASDRRYFDVTLSICPVSIPSIAARALYVEQSIRGSAPYRQRLYVLGSGANPETTATSRVFEFNEPSSVVGLCDRGEAQTFAAEDVVEREGCTVTLQLSGERFTGRTDGRLCLSSLMGATYATTELTLDARTLESWDRGYDATGRQVWGATAGAYRFERRSALAPLQ